MKVLPAGFVEAAAAAFNVARRYSLRICTEKVDLKWDIVFDFLRDNAPINAYRPAGDFEFHDSA
eukprot:4036849-Pyramimonas_sp.AAC.1